MGTVQRDVEIGSGSVIGIGVSGSGMPIFDQDGETIRPFGRSPTQTN